jgi:hypothetical protein
VVPSSGLVAGGRIRLSREQVVDRRSSGSQSREHYVDALLVWRCGILPELTPAHPPESAEETSCSHHAGDHHDTRRLITSLAASTAAVSLALAASFPASAQSAAAAPRRTRAGRPRRRPPAAWRPSRISGPCHRPEDRGTSCWTSVDDRGEVSTCAWPPGRMTAAGGARSRAACTTPAAVSNTRPRSCSGSTCRTGKFGRMGAAFDDRA